MRLWQQFTAKSLMLAGVGLVSGRAGPRVERLQTPALGRTCGTGCPVVMGIVFNYDILNFLLNAKRTYLVVYSCLQSSNLLALIPEYDFKKTKMLV